MKHISLSTEELNSLVFIIRKRFHEEYKKDLKRVVDEVHQSDEFILFQKLLAQKKELESQIDTLKETIETKFSTKLTDVIVRENTQAPTPICANLRVVISDNSIKDLIKLEEYDGEESTKELIIENVFQKLIS